MKRFGAWLLLCLALFGVPARADERPYVVLALSGGGIKGYAHIGVLDVLERHGVGVDGIVGTSVNTCSDILLKHGCMQAMNLDGGSSAMMWFDGKYVMQSSSSPLRYSGGRPTPNAWVYKRASAITEE